MKNASRVFEVYEDLFSLQQDDKSLEDYYSHFKGMIDELNQYDPVTNDIKVLKKQHEELYVCKFLSELSSQLKPLRGQLLADEGDSLCKILSHDYLRLQNLLQQDLIPLQLRALPWFSTNQGNTSRAVVVCLFMIIVYLLEAKVLVVIRIILESVLIAIKPITLLTDIRSCMTNLPSLLKLLICLVQLDYLLHMT